MSTEMLNKRLRSEWRELGFYYESDDQTKEWHFIGSRAGLLRFRDLLLQYVADSRNEIKSEHEHYGSYSYLEVMTWSEPGMDGHSIHGSLDDLRRLAGIVERKLLSAQPGTIFRIAGEYTEAAEYALILLVREDDFDPAAADPGLAHING
jgi:hypothetical protein